MRTTRARVNYVAFMNLDGICYVKVMARTTESSPAAIAGLSNAKGLKVGAVADRIRARSRLLKQERLKAVAIKRGDRVHDAGARGSHDFLRRMLSDGGHAYAEDGEVEGFITNKSRFVDRAEAKKIAIAVGQVNESWRRVTRPLLSSDLNW